MRWSSFAGTCAALMATTLIDVAAADRLSIVEDERALTVRAGEKTILKYNVAAVPSPDRSKPYYARSGHIHPVYTPKGHMVTGDMCPDHIHQHAIWFAWTNASFEGRKIDFWNSKAQQGRVEHSAVLGKEHSDTEATFSVRLRHQDTTGDEPSDVLHETWNVRVKAVDEVYVIDLESIQQCATDVPLLLKKYHYGAMGLRSPMAWNAPDGGFLTSEGKTRENGNHSRPTWVDSFGPVEGGTAGVTVMQHPSNFRYPQPARLHPRFSYFCFAPMVLGDFSIEPGRQYVSRFRYVVHDGQLDKAVTKKLWSEFAKMYGGDKSDNAVSVKLIVTADGSLSLAGKDIQEDQLTAELKQLLDNVTKQGHDAKSVTVIIAADPQARTGLVQQMIKLAQNAGVERFVLRAVKTPTDEP